MNFDISRIGQDLGFGGFILSNGTEFYLIPLPEEVESIRQNLGYIVEGAMPARCEPSSEEIAEAVKDACDIVIDTRNGVLEKIFFQTDVVETSVIDPDNYPQRIIVRKSQRQMDSKVQWDVFRRDNFVCRYCGANNVPLTVDHIMTWESGGPTIVENLVSACKKCNKTRGNTAYGDWLESDYYKKVSNSLPLPVLTANNNLLIALNSGDIRPMVSKRKR